MAPAPYIPGPVADASVWTTKDFGTTDGAFRAARAWGAENVRGWNGWRIEGCITGDKSGSYRIHLNPGSANAPPVYATQVFRLRPLKRRLPWKLALQLEDALRCASLKNASFSMDAEKDAEIKEAIRIWLGSWIIPPTERTLAWGRGEDL